MRRSVVGGAAFCLTIVLCSEERLLSWAKVKQAVEAV